MKIKFTKMQGLGNDFVVIDGVTQSINLSTSQIKRLANRHLGIGCDQLLLLEKSTNAEAELNYRIFNADGTEVEQCGNGARCIARFAVDHGLVASRQFQVATKKQILALKVLDNNDVMVNMGYPNFIPEKIPLTAALNKTYQVSMKGQLITFQALSIGNPHAIIWLEDIDNFPREEIGEAFNQHTLFPEGVNVSFARKISDEYVQLMVYERGVGSTLACGSAACATGVAGIAADLLAPTVTVSQPGGDLLISWEGDNTPIYMTGPAEYVFEGSL